MVPERAGMRVDERINCMAASALVGGRSSSAGPRFDVDAAIYPLVREPPMSIMTCGKKRENVGEAADGAMRLL
jgi:hypothetical protein